MKINSKQLPVKVHYFFFMAGKYNYILTLQHKFYYADMCNIFILLFITAMGPILPFLPVYGKQLGVSAIVMGSITAILPFLFLIAKPIFGLIVDYFSSWRKAIFVTLLAGTSTCFVCMYFLSIVSEPVLPDHTFINVSCALPYCSLKVSFYNY